MRPLIIQNVEELGRVSFLVTILYDEEGQPKDQTVYEYIGDRGDALVKAAEIAEIHNYRTPLYWTSTRELCVAAISSFGFAPYLKRREDTQETARLIETYRDVLSEVYEIVPIEEPQETEEPKELARWRRIIIRLCETIIAKLRN